MADIFLSYSRTNQDRVEKLASALNDAGYSVWWDHNLQGGARFAAEIASELDAADVVVVAWSDTAGQSEWVLDEAAHARDADKLLPIRLDESLPPLGFRQRQAVDFSSWKGDASSAPFTQLVAAIETIRTGEAKPAPATPPAAAKSGGRNPVMLAAVAAMAVLIIAGVFVWRTSGDGADTLAGGAGPADAGAAVGANDPASDSARDPGRDNDRDADGKIGLAVLPFVNMSTDPEQEFFADGLTEELLNWLANVEGLNVPARTTSFSFKGKNIDLREIGDLLNVRYILEGSIRHYENDLRITVQLINSETGFHLWSETYDRTFDDLFSIQDELANTVVVELLGRIPETGATNPAAVGDVDPQAHRLYLEGRGYWARRLSDKAYAKFRAAADLDPNHWLAEAYIAVIAAYERFNGGSLPIDGVLSEVMNTALSKAVALRPEAADVLFAQGWVSEFGFRRVDGSGEAPDDVDPAAYEFYRQALRAYPRHVEALHAVARAQKNRKDFIKALRAVLEIEPALSPARMNLINAMIAEGETDGALREIRILERFEVYGYEIYAADFYRRLGANDARLAGLFRAGAPAEPDHEFVLRRRAMALAEAGQRDDAGRLLALTAQNEPPSAHRQWIGSMAAAVNGDMDDSVAHLKLGASRDDRAGWYDNVHARALISIGEYEDALALLSAAGPDIAAPDPSAFNIGVFDGVTDFNFYFAALALQGLGRDEEARQIWLSALEAINAKPLDSWAQHIGLAIIYANIDEHEKAFAALERGYDEGFRYLLTYNCAGCVGTDFYERNGYFSAIFDDPRFAAYVEKIERDNRERFVTYDERADITGKVDAMAAVLEQSIASKADEP